MWSQIPTRRRRRSVPILSTCSPFLISALTLDRGRAAGPRGRRLTRSATLLNPVLAVSTASEFWLATHELFAIDRRMLDQGETIINLSKDRDAIIAALDMVFTGI